MPSAQAHGPMLRAHSYPLGLAVNIEMPAEVTKATKTYGTMVVASWAMSFCKYGTPSVIHFGAGAPLR
jgi:hypothetical protein